MGAQRESCLHPSTVEILATVLFAFAILHTFTATQFDKLGHRYPEGSVGENFFHMLGEVEVVFGLWAGIFMIGYTAVAGSHDAIHYLETRNYTEPVFVFAIMTVAATRPVLDLCSSIIKHASRLIPAPEAASFYMAALIVGPLLGSFITEPAAMTVTALILKERYYDQGLSKRFMYATIGLLFVNVSIGGTLTHFAAPPVLMVAASWEWDMAFMLGHFGWKAALAVVLNTVLVATLFQRNLRALGERTKSVAPRKGTSPSWLIGLHVLFLGGIVMSNHHMVVFMGVFLFFLGCAAVTDEYQDELKIKEALLVGFFLGGLVTLGGLQAWWLAPVLTSLGEGPLFVGATGLTAFTDNAALTYLGTTVGDLGALKEYALVAGAVAGGGLTVIANAPNPAGYGILKPSFGADGINPLKLLLAALGPTAIAMLCLWFLPHL